MVRLTGTVTSFRERKISPREVVKLVQRSPSFPEQLGHAGPSISHHLKSAPSLHLGSQVLLSLDNNCSGFAGILAARSDRI